MRALRETAFGWLPLGVALCLFLPAIPGAQAILDDQGLLLAPQHPNLWAEWYQPTFVQAYGRGSAVWRPLVASVWDMIAVFGRELWIFKVFNVLLCLGCLHYFQRVARGCGASAPWAALLALGWLLHPGTVDTVLWASCAFDLGAIFCLLLAIDRGLSGKSIAFALMAALLCKETALGAGVGIPLLLWGHQKKPQIGAALGMVGAYLGLRFLLPLPQLNPGPLGLAESGAALLQLATSLHGPLQAGFGHIFMPDEAPDALGGLLLLGLVGLQFYDRKAGLSLFLWLIFLGPVALGLPLLGLRPLRYLCLPLAMALPALGALRILAYYRWFLAVGLLLSLGPRAWSRGGEWQNEESLWFAELEIEPENPYLQRQLILHLYLQDGIAAHPGILDVWATAIDRMPHALAFYDPQEEHWNLAQAALLSGEAPLALQQVQQYRAIKHDQVSPNVWCLEADALSQLQADPEAIAHADAQCRPSP